MQDKSVGQSYRICNLLFHLHAKCKLVFTIPHIKQREKKIFVLTLACSGGIIKVIRVCTKNTLLKNVSHEILLSFSNITCDISFSFYNDDKVF